MDKPKERILETSVKLFYTQGYDYTSINQIIEESKTHKASFYRYYTDKINIASDYLDFQGQGIKDLIQKLAAKSNSIEEFITSWVRIIKKQTRMGLFLGCPITRFLNGSFIQDKNLQEKGHTWVNSWISEIKIFCDRLKAAKALDKDLDSEFFARKTIKLFQGNSALYAISREMKVWDEFAIEVMDKIN